MALLHSSPQNDCVTIQELFVASGMRRLVINMTKYIGVILHECTWWLLVFYPTSLRVEQHCPTRSETCWHGWSFGRCGKQKRHTCLSPGSIVFRGVKLTVDFKGKSSSKIWEFPSFLRCVVCMWPFFVVRVDSEDECKNCQIGTLDSLDSSLVALSEVVSSTRCMLRYSMNLLWFKVQESI